MVPSMVGEAKGCPFANRCPHVLSACEGGHIDFAAATPGHKYRCLLSATQSLKNFREAAE
jgi:peptide/nickel transport system ATP-binding protein